MGGGDLASNPAEGRAIAQFRARFRHGPIGVWTTVLGAGWDNLYGCAFEFRLDCTGLATAYDVYDDEEPESRTEFIWRCIDDFTIETEPVGEKICEEAWGVIRYDFRFATSKYGGDRMLVLYEVNDDERGDSGFWWSPNHVVLANECSGDLV